MIYLLEGTETYQLDQKKRQLLKKGKTEGENIIDLDASARTFSLEGALNQCSTISLFGERRAVILSDPYFLKSGTRAAGKKKTGKDNSDLLEAYCTAPNPDTDLYLICRGFSPDRRTKELKVLEAHENESVQIFRFLKLSPRELNQRISEELRKKGYQLTDDALAELKERISDSYTEFLKTLDKMDLYGKKQLNRKDIEHLVSLNPDTNIWKLGDCFLSQDAAGTFRALDTMKASGYQDVRRILPVFASRIRKIYSVVRCYECGLSYEEIRKVTGSYYPDKDLGLARGRSSAYFLRLLSELADLDQSGKRGETDPSIEFDLFLLRNLNHGA
ncbi:MAG: DNA polymerase III subunit delta [Anaerolactibacter massiliensis]|nr:DNA polymerase III subunit delta [Anaerolactibacter massiliensis]